MRAALPERLSWSLLSASALLLVAGVPPPARAEDAVTAATAPEPSPPVRARFNGLDRLQAAHQGREAFPPDTSIAAGELRVLQAANSALRLSAPNGGEAIVKSLNDFFNVPDKPLLFQPRVYYDRMAKRFYVAALGVDPASRESTLYVAVSSVFVEVDNLEVARVFQDGGTWCSYRFDVGLKAGAPTFPGSLALGQNESWIVLATDNYRFNDGGFRIASLHVIDKLSLSNFVSGPCPSPAYARINVPRDADGRRAFALQPAQHYTNHEVAGRRPLYLVSSQALVGSSDAYTLWRLSGEDTATLQLASTSLRGGFVYRRPPTAPQRNGPDLDTGDDRITQAAFRDGKVWAVHATACELGPPPTESCLRLVEITPGALGDAFTGAITGQENLGRRDLFLWAPGVAVNFAGDVLVPYQRSRARQPMGIGYAVRRAAKGVFDALGNLSGGQCPLMNFDEEGRNLTGATAGAQAEPGDDLAFWIAGEYPAVLEGLGCDWRTRVGRVRDTVTPRRPPIVLATGRFTLPPADGPASPNFSLKVDLRAAVPEAGLQGTSGRLLTLALADVGRPNVACEGHHPRNGCAAIDYPLVGPDLFNSSWLSVALADGRRRLFLTESQDLSAVPDPLKPD